MKLSKEVLDQGRSFVLNRKLYELNKWQREHIPAFKFDPKDYFQKAYELDMDGIKLFDSLYLEVDPDVEAVKLVVTKLVVVVFSFVLLLVLLLLILGSIVGIVYLLN